MQRTVLAKINHFFSKVCNFINLACFMTFTYLYRIIYLELYIVEIALLENVEQDNYIFSVSYCDSLMCTTHDQYICGFYPAMNIINMHTTLVVCKHAISLEVCCHTYSEPSTPNTVFKTH